MKTLLVSLILTLSMQAAFAKVSNQASEKKAILALENAAKNLSVINLSCSTITDCIYLPLGKQACGGAQDFLLVSSNNENFSEISYLAAKSEEREDKYNTNYSIFSTCSEKSPVMPKCVKKVCIK